jgi:asparagine synthase (glutamine-hydrolysing)
MCGIVGFRATSPIEDTTLIETMRDTMRHRGPDDAGTWISADRRIALAQRRLAIIDLSPNGHQPMTDVSGKLSLTFNGEIYNYQELRRDLEGRGHRFRTATDTEVILEAYRAWGTNCLSHFNGMFAFALYDVETQRLFLARDRAGEKPLFYRHAQGQFAFASELKALMADPAFPRQLDLNALEYYLTYGYVPGSLCILKSVCKLPQGHALTYDLPTDTLRVWPYWTLPEPVVDPAADVNSLMEELEALLLDSVRLRLIADVPVGVLLSGGIDSSLVTAMAVRASSRPVKTFNISFPGHGVYDESPYARLVAEHFGTEHVELAAEPATVELLPELARQYDEPMADSSMVPTYLVSRLIREHATVALGGDGGDELFGGYPHYNWIRQQEQMRRFVPRPFRRLVGAGAARFLPPGLRGRNYLIGFSEDLPRSIAHVGLFFDRASRRRLLAPVMGGSTGDVSDPEGYKVALCNRGLTLIQQATSVDFQTYLVDDILVKVDRASMLTSLEVRSPFLDPRIIELAFGRVPDSLRAAGGECKILPRRLAGRLLPAALDLKRKQGFGMPLDKWFKGEWGRYMVQVLSEADGDLFDPGPVRSLVANQHRGLFNTQRLFALTVFELWRRHYRVSP